MIAMAVPIWLDSLVFGYRTLLTAGTELVKRNQLNFGSPFTVTDDAPNTRTNIVIPAANFVPTNTDNDKVLVTAAAVPAWAFIDDANIDAAAAIACTKTDGAFVGVAISTTNKVTTPIVEVGTAPFPATGAGRFSNNTFINWVHAGNDIQTIGINAAGGLEIGGGANRPTSAEFSVDSSFVFRVSGTFSYQVFATRLRCVPTEIRFDTDGLLSSAHATDNDIAIHATPASWNTMQKGMFWGESGAPPNAVPAAGAFVWVAAGAIKAMGSTAATVKTLAPAGVATLNKDDQQNFSVELAGGAGVTNIFTYVTTNDTTVTIEADVLAHDAVANESAGYRRIATFRNNAGGIAQVGATTAVHTVEEDAAWDCTVDDDGAATIRLRAIPDGANNTRYTGRVTILEKAD